MLIFMRNRFAIVLTLLATTAPASPKPPRIASAYTKLQWERCTIIESGQRLYPPEDWEQRRCDGYVGIPIFWDYDDARDDIDAGVPNYSAAISGPPHGLGEAVEWRLADGKPFAIIYRVETSSRGGEWPNGRWARLIVETIGKPNKPGCPVAQFDALSPNANIAARRAADAVLTGKRSCIDFDE